jgi:hypothetical protein
VWRNLGEAIEKTVPARHICIKTHYARTEPPPADEQLQPPPDGVLDVRGRPRPLVAEITLRYTVVQELVLQSRSIHGISRDRQCEIRAPVRGHQQHAVCQRQPPWADPLNIATTAPHQRHQLGPLWNPRRRGDATNPAALIASRVTNLSGQDTSGLSEGTW